MTEQPPKLDVQTLEYVLGMIINEVMVCYIKDDIYKRKGDEKRCTICSGKMLAFSSLSDKIRRLIRKQEEA